DAENPEILLRIRIHRDRTLEMEARQVVTSRVVVGPAERTSRRDGTAVQFHRGVCLDERLAGGAERAQQKREPLVRRRVPWIPLDRATELPPGLAPIPIVDESTPGERRMCFRERVVELD